MIGNYRSRTRGSIHHHSTKATANTAMKLSENTYDTNLGAAQTSKHCHQSRLGARERVRHSEAAQNSQIQQAGIHWPSVDLYMRGLQHAAEMAPSATCCTQQLAGTPSSRGADRFKNASTWAPSRGASSVPGVSPPRTPAGQPTVSWPAAALGPRCHASAAVLLACCRHRASPRSAAL